MSEEPRKKRRKRKRRPAPEYQKIAGSDFTEVPKPKEQAIALIFGLPGHGKTTFGLAGAPGPVAFFDIDKRGFHAAKKARRRKVIQYLPIEYPKNIGKMNHQQVIRMAQQEMDSIRRHAEIVIRENEKGNIRTVVFDTVTELCQLANMSITGRADKRQDDFGRSTHIVKTVLTDLFKLFRECDANVIMLARAKEIWAAREPTGKYTYRGEDLLEYEADWAGHIRLKKDKKTKLHTKQEHELEITKAGIDLSQLGQIYTSDDWGKMGPFVYACLMNYPGTDEEDWR